MIKSYFQVNPFLFFLFGASCATNVLSLPSFSSSKIKLLLFCQRKFTQKNVLDRISESVKDEYNTLIKSKHYPRCHLDLQQWRCTLSRIPAYPRQLTYAHTSQNTRYNIDYTFDCALSGPFDNLFLTWFSAPQALCKGIIAVISASTVW